MNTSRTPTTHALKTDPIVFDDVKNRIKTFEIRKDDRNYQVGDNLRLQKTQYTGDEMRSGMPLLYTGEELEVWVQHILRGPIYGLQEGWVIMSISEPVS